MADVKRVRATAAGYAPKYPGAPVQRIKANTEFKVLAHQKGSWFVDLDPEPEPAEASPQRRRKKPEDPATETETGSPLASE